MRKKRIHKLHYGSMAAVSFVQRPLPRLLRFFCHHVCRGNCSVLKYDWSNSPLLEELAPKKNCCPQAGHLDSNLIDTLLPKRLKLNLLRLLWQGYRASLLYMTGMQPAYAGGRPTVPRGFKYFSASFSSVAFFDSMHFSYSDWHAAVCAPVLICKQQHKAVKPCHIVAVT